MSDLRIQTAPNGWILHDGADPRSCMMDIVIGVYNDVDQLNEAIKNKLLTEKNVNIFEMEKTRNKN